jgi:DNA replication protein DnaC
MLIHPTVDRLRALGLAAMADTFVELQNNPEAAEMPHADWLGLLVDREVTADQRRDLLEIVDDRYDKGSLLITSQVPVSQWHDVIADPTLGDAILDRIIHNAHRIELKGDSLRRQAGEKKKP